MSKTSDKQQQLVATLKELFMMDQADLDFGIYRIMNAKHTEIEGFLNNELLPTIRETLQAGGKATDTQKELDDAIKQAQELGADPDTLPKVQQLKALLGDGANNSLEKDEAEIFSHLTTFFSRYYDGGDFMSLRRYKQETYSPLPMNGEEVKLHWANADQYYIKSAESFSNYAFKLGNDESDNNNDNNKKTVRFELVQASTEQNNKKEASDKERRFILDENQPVSIRQHEGKQELILHFNYQPDSEKRTQKNINLATIEWIKTFNGEGVFENQQDWLNWQAELLAPKPTDKNKNRTVLEKYLTDYTAKNSFDYFIHKDLGRFLRRELDFFIKNELLLLDDIVPDSTDALASQLLSNERSLKKIVAFKGIALKLIAFLAQLEDFQKKLWLKKKFVLESNYCMTLDRVPEAFYGEILANQQQLDEWVELGFIDKETTKDTKVTKQSLKENPYLLIDTGLFDEDFKQRLLAEIDDIDEQMDGLLIHSENFQALNLLQERYREQVKCVYIDPPYNTGEDGFAYKDAYQYSSWLSMMSDRAVFIYKILQNEGVFLCSIDDYEFNRLHLVLRDVFGDSSYEATFIRKRRSSSAMSQNLLSQDHEYVVCFTKDGFEKAKGIEKNYSSYSNPDNDPRGDWTLGDLTVGMDSSQRPNQFYELVSPFSGKKYPANPNRVWSYIPSSMNKKIEEGIIAFPDDPSLLKIGITITGPMLKRFKSNLKSNVNPVSTLIGVGTGFIEEDGITKLFSGLNTAATKEIQNIFGENKFSYAKPMSLVSVLEEQFCNSKNTILDYFAGSGTTAHATINLNREDKGNRKYILVEMGEYFDTVLKPRIKKVVYSENWKNGKPVADKDGNYNGVSHCFKYNRLESYEDVVDNLQLQRTEIQADLLNNPDNKNLKEDYLLNYMLDIEAKGSLFSRELFIDPFNAKMRVVRDNETKQQAIDLVETFNYLLGLRVESTRKQQGMVEVIGTNPADESVHIIWRNLKQTDNDALDEWFRKQSYNTRDREFDRVYVNGDNNLPNLKTSEESWKVQLIEEAFETLMFDCQDV